MTDYGPPIPLRKGKGGILKIKRGGTGKVSNSGNAAGRFRVPGRALRDVKTGRQLPWPPRGAPIWNPADPFFIENPCTPVTRRQRRWTRAFAKMHGFEHPAYDVATDRWVNIPRNKLDNQKEQVDGDGEA